MRKDRQVMLWLCAAAGGILALLWGRGEAADGLGELEKLAGPGLRLGAWLRELSLSGAGGNLAAWALVLVLCALPLLALVLLRLRRGRFCREDVLAVLMVPQLFALLYTLVNPALLEGEVTSLFPEMRSFFYLEAAGTLCSTGVAWAALAVLRGLEDRSARGLPRVLCPLLTAGAALMALAAGLEGVSGFLREEHALTAGLITLMQAVPTLLGGLVLLWGEALVRAMGEELFTRETALLCARTAAGCRMAAQASVILSLSANLIQLALFPVLYAGQFRVEIPLLSLTLSAALYLLCRSLERGRELQEDSDSII